MAHSVDLAKHIADYATQWSRENAPAHLAVSTIHCEKVSFAGAINYHQEGVQFNTYLDTIKQFTLENDTDEFQVATVGGEEEISNSYIWSTDQAFSLGMEVSTSFRVPLFGGVDPTISTGYSFRSTQAQAETRTRRWNFKQPVRVPPRSQMVALLLLEKTTPYVPFDMEGALTGVVGVQFVIPGTTSGPYCEFPLFQVLAEKPLANFITAGSVTYFHTEGVFTANQGIKATVKFTLYLLDQPHRSIKEWTIDVTPERQMPKVSEEEQQRVQVG